jgi:EF hand
MGEGSRLRKFTPQVHLHRLFTLGGEVRAGQAGDHIRMPLPTLILPILAAAGQVTPSSPITVTGHSWAPFISPMGEPFRAHSASDDTLADWFRLADRNHDGVLTADEMVADAERFFATLDTNYDGEIDPDELARYEYEIAPDIQVMSKTRRAVGQPAPAVRPSDAGYEDSDTSDSHDRRRRRERVADEEASLGIGGTLQGAARYSLLNIPEPVAAADTDFNRAITIGEFKAACLARFQLLDSAHQGKLTLAGLEALPHVPNIGPARVRRKDNAADVRIGNPLPPGN